MATAMMCIGGFTTNIDRAPSVSSEGLTLIDGSTARGKYEEKLPNRHGV
jgi:hypothetical protein